MKIIVGEKYIEMSRY